MKPATAVFAMLMFAAASAAAQPGYFSSDVTARPAHVKAIVKNYVACLESANPGVVESALAHLVAWRSVEPAIDRSSVRDAIRGLAERVKDSDLRYKAYLAEMALADASIISRDECVTCGSANELFVRVAENANARLLSVADRGRR